MLVLLIAAAAVSTILGASLPEQRREKAYVDGIAIWVAVLVVVSVGAGNDYQKELQFRKLNADRDVVNTKVIRGGKQGVVPSSELVVGDLVLLETGDKVPADGILVEPFRALQVDESALTGEADAVHKTGDHPFIISGTQVVEGEGRFVVLAVGPRTEWGRLIALASGDLEATPLQDKLADLAGLVAKIGFGVAVSCFVVLFIFLAVEIRSFPTTGVHWVEVLDIFLYCVTIIVVAVPEGLPLAVTISLAYSMKKMMKDNNFVRHLAACETMGGATCICTDKTGTLTQNRMAVVEAWAGGRELPRAPARGDLGSADEQLLCEGIAVNSKAFLIEEEGGGAAVIGNRTEGALLLLLRDWGVDAAALRESTPVVAIGGFTAQRKMSSAAIAEPGGGRCRLHVKGAAEIVLRRCIAAVVDASGSRANIAADENLRRCIEAHITGMASRGLRTLAIAVRPDAPLPATDADVAGLEEELTLLSVVGIKDPVRTGVPATITACQQAGINVRMVTGVSHCPPPPPPMARVESKGPATRKFCTRNSFGCKILDGNVRRPASVSGDLKQFSTSSGWKQRLMRVQSVAPMAGKTCELERVGFGPRIDFSRCQRAAAVPCLAIQRSCGTSLPYGRKAPDLL